MPVEPVETAAPVPPAPCGPGSTRARRRRGDAGQSSAEYLGAIVVAVLVVTALLVGTTQIGRHVGAGIQAAICRIAGGGCTVDALLHVPDDECEVYSHSAEVTGDVVLFSVDVGGSGKLTLSKSISPDGKVNWYVQQEGDLHAGADFLLGEEAHLGDLGEGVSAEVKGLLTAGGGAKMAFGSEADAREFMTAAAHEPVKLGLTGWDPTGITHWLADKIDGHHYAPPAPTEYFFEGGGKFEGSIDAEAGVGGGGGDGGVSGVVGVKVTPQPEGGPDRTVYLKLTQDAALKLGLLDVAEVSGGTENEVVIGLTYGDDGQPKKASVEAAGSLKGSFSTTATGEEGTLADRAGFTPKGAAEFEGTAETGMTGKIAFSMDLTDAGNAAALANGLHSLGVPVLNGYGSVPPPDPITGVAGIYHRFDAGADGTSVTVTTYDDETGGNTLGAKGGDGLTFGAEAGLEFEDHTLKNGYYYSPGDGFVKWEACGA